MELNEKLILAQKGDKSAKALILKENSGLIWSIVKKFMGRGVDPEDLFQLGAIGILKSIDRFDQSVGVKFSTYAVPVILGEIKRFFRDDGMIKISRPIKELSVKVKRMQDVIEKSGKEATVSQLAEALGESVSSVTLALEAGYTVDSIYSEEDNKVLNKADNNNPNDDKIIELMSLRRVIEGLPENEKQLIIIRYFYDKPQREAAEALGMSQVQVSRMEKKILSGLRQEME